MSKSGEQINLRHFMVGLINFSPEEKLLGRTLIQKLSYFSLPKHIRKEIFIPHHFGPYSQKISDVRTQSVNLGFIEERKTKKFGYTSYSYALNEDGRELWGGIKKELSQNVKETIQKTINTTRDNNYWYNSAKISMAAKIEYIEEVGNPSNKEEIIEKGKQFGWDIPRKEIEIRKEFIDSLNQ